MNLTRFKKGDLVQWQKNSKAMNSFGIVIDVQPRNVYEPDACEILDDSGETVIISSRQLLVANREKAK